MEARICGDSLDGIPGLGGSIVKGFPVLVGKSDGVAAIEELICGGRRAISEAI